MISRLFKNFLPIFSLLTALTACSLLEQRSEEYEIEDQTLADLRAEKSNGSAHRHHRTPVVNYQGKKYLGRYEWAVQSYESGEYDLAIVEFQKLKNLGSTVPNFEKIPFYLGMSHFKKSNWAVAQPLLEEYVHQNLSDSNGQEARISLLYIYEKQKNWNTLATLAAETETVNLFQTNRIQQKLLWARALRAQHELQGARIALKEAFTQLQNIPASLSDPYSEDLNEDLWGRYYFTELDIQVETCVSQEPREKKQKKKLSRLYSQWMAGVTDCLRGVLRTANQELFPTESKWSENATVSLEEGIALFVGKIQQFQSSEKENIAQWQSIEKEARQQLYQVFNLVDADLKQFREQSLPTNSLLHLRKQLDLLIVSLSSPSSSK